MKQNRSLFYVICNAIFLGLLGILPLITQWTDQQMSKTINMSYAWMDFLLLIILGALVAISHHLAAAATTKLVLLAELIKMGVLVCVILIPYGQRTLISVNVICLAISAVNFLFAVRIANKVKSV